MRGLLDSPDVTVPKRARVRGQPHMLAYINDEEAALLRSRGGGVNRDGGQIMHRGVPSYYDADGSGNATDSGNPDGSAGTSGVSGNEEGGGGDDYGSMSSVGQLAAQLVQPAAPLPMRAAQAFLDMLALNQNIGVPSVSLSDNYGPRPSSSLPSFADFPTLAPMSSMSSMAPMAPMASMMAPGAMLPQVGVQGGMAPSMAPTAFEAPMSYEDYLRQFQDFRLAQQQRGFV